MKDKVRLTLLKHPFSSEREIKYIDITSFQNMIDEFIQSKYPNEYLAVYDKDRKVLDFNETPKTNEVIIRVLPSGERDADTGVNRAKVGVGFITSVIGTALLFTGVGAPLGWILLGTGMSMMGAELAMGIVTTMFNDMVGEDTSSKVAPSIRGGRNQIMKNEPIPILLGEHLIIPFYAAPHYVTTSGNNQYLHQAFLIGYNNVIVDESSIKVGEELIANYNEFEYEIITDGSPSLLYPERVIDNTIGKLVENTLEDTSSGAVVRTTSSNTNRITVDVAFTQGLVYWKDGERTNLSVAFTIEYSIDNGSTWTPWISQTKTANLAETLRYTYTKDLDNATPAGVDYNVNRQYQIRVTRTTADRTDSKYVDKFYFTNLKSHTAVFDDIGGVNTEIISAAVRNKLTLLFIKVRATDQFNGAIDQLNCIAQLQTKDFDGVSWVDNQLTSNPASIFRYVLQDTNVNTHPVPDTEIDWESLEAWHMFCESKGYSFNAYINRETTIQNLLGIITSVGRASWSMVDNKFTVVIDDIKPEIVQHFSARNSWNYSGSKNFDYYPTVIKGTFINKDSNYTEEQRLVYYDNVVDDSEENSISFYGVTNEAQVWSLSQYQHKVARLRPEIHSFNADIESIVCTRGDRIKFQHDVPMFGLNSGRILDISDDGVNITGFTSDELLSFEVGKTYQVRIRTNDGASLLLDIYNTAITEDVETNEVLIANTIAVGSFEVQDLFMFGESGIESVDLIVSNIETLDNFEVKLTCVDYSPEIFDDTLSPDTYNAQISRPANQVGDLTITKVYNPDDALIDTINQSNSVDNEKLTPNSITQSKIDTTDIFTMTLQSTNYVPGLAGFNVDKDGDAEFNNVTVRGEIDATTGSLGTLSVDGTVTIGPAGSIVAGLTTLNSTGITANQGTIGGWTINATDLISTDGSVALRSNVKSLEIKDSFGDMRIITGYMGNAPAGWINKDGDQLGASDYGVYVGGGNLVVADGAKFENGDYLINRDAGYTILTSSGEEVGRFGNVKAGTVGLRIGTIDEDAGTGDGIYVDETGKAVFSGELTVGTMPTLSDEGLVAHWSLDDGSGTRAVDNTGNGNDGTLVGFGPVAEYHFDGDLTDEQGGADLTVSSGSSAYETGVVGQGAGGARFVATGITPGLVGSVSFWIKQSTLVAPGTGIIFGNVETNSIAFRQGDTAITANTFDMLVVDSGVAYGGHDVGTIILGQYQHVVITWNNGTIQLFVDNVLTYTVVAPTSGWFPANQIFQLGINYSNTGQVNDDFRIYDYALSPAEISALYNRPQQPSHWVDGISGRALAFDGKNSYYESVKPIIINGNEATFTFWHDGSANNIGVAGTRNFVFDLGSSDTSKRLIIASQYEGVKRFAVYHAAWYAFNPIYYPDSLSLIGIIISGATAYLYINGALKQSISITSPYSVMGETITRIGAAYNAVSSVLSCLIDEPRIYNRALSADEIKYLYWNPAGGGNRTTINGGQILADSITAREIKAGTITADNIQSGTITALEIASRSLAATVLQAGTITTNELNMENLFAQDIVVGQQIRAGYNASGDELEVGKVAGFWLNGDGKFKAVNADLLGTLRTGENASKSARVAIQDESGITDGPNFTGTGVDDLIILGSGTVAGNFEVEITSQATIYSVGDTGPAGGKIFYIDTSTTPVTYYEVWTVNESSAQWSTSTTSIPGTLSSIGSGYNNTYNILNTSSFPAAQIARNASHGGFTDWFLPSVEEGVEINRQSAILGLATNTYLWTSTQSLADTSRAYAYRPLDFPNYSQFTKTGSTTFRVCRKFQTTDSFRWRETSNAWSSAIEMNSTNLPLILNNGTDYGITISFSNVIGHVVLDDWTFTQGSMIGLSIKNSLGEEYISTSSDTFVMPYIPTSTTGLPTGALYRDGNIIKIVL